MERNTERKEFSHEVGAQPVILQHTLKDCDMRLFTAIDISVEVREELRRLLNRLRPLAKLNWSPVENMHITTKFIGEWPEQTARRNEARAGYNGVS